MINDSINQNQTPSEYIDLRELSKRIWSGKLIILATAILSLILGASYALYLPNIFKSNALLAPVQPETSFSRNAQSYSSLASIAGISLPVGQQVGNTKEALEKIRSLSFFEQEIYENIFLPNLMAEKAFNPISMRISYDANSYDEINKKWVRKVKNKKQVIPTAQESHIEFMKILSLREDAESGFINISVEHISPYVSKAWVDLIVKKINSAMRSQEKKIAEASIAYLNDEMSKTNFAEIKVVLSELVQNQIQQLALIEANEAYVFRYIDPPVVEELKYKPQRSIICIMSLFFGLILGVAIALINSFRKN